MEKSFEIIYSGKVYIINIKIILNFWGFVDFESKTGPNNSCWEWIGGKQPNGYGSYQLNPLNNPSKKFITVRAHRFALALIESIPSRNIYACHKCDNPGCVKPSHLFLGTNSQNIIDSMNKGRLKIPYPGKGDDNVSTIVSDNNVTQIRYLVANGVNYDEISDRFGIGKSQISKICCNKARVDHNYIPRNRNSLRKYTEKDLQIISEMRDKGMSYAEISRELNINSGIVWKLVRRIQISKDT